ncbi:MAG: class I adenylate-forming enzyme family protein, partial [Acidobacteriota bacterium]
MISPPGTRQSPKSIDGAFDALLNDDPSARALVDGKSGAVTTRSELDRRAALLGRAMAAAGLVEGDSVAAQLPNSVDFVATFLATLRLRCTFVSIDRDARESEVGAILHGFGLRGLVYAPEKPGEPPMISVREVRGPRQERSGVALIKLTSGSTGLPRGILTSASNLIADCRNICGTMGITPDDLNLGAIPFSHSYGFSNLVTPLLVQGTAIVISNDYLPLSTLSLANRHGCTVLPGIPMMFDHLAASPRSDGRFKTVRTFISAGAPLTPSVSARFRERFGARIHSFYGCSECGGIAYDREGGAVERGRVGTAMEGVKVTVGEMQRLTVSSEAVAVGYLDGGSRDESRFERGTFLTDDLARIDATGEVELIGRFGDLIITAGKKVNPREVEKIILQLTGVREVKVYGEH